VKLPAHRVGLPGNEISFFIVPLDPAYKAGLTGQLPVKKCKKYSHHFGILLFLSIKFVIKWIGS
jgi:hypothetical protein